MGSSPPHQGPALRRRIRNLTPEAAVVSLALRRRQTGSGDTMDPTRHSGIVDGLEAMKAAGLIIRYNLTWERPGGEPKVAVRAIRRTTSCASRSPAAWPVWLRKRN